jgi:hypothetical protein
MGYNSALRDEMLGEGPMRGRDARTAALFSYVSCEARVPFDHPLRPIRQIVDETLSDGRSSVAPAKLLRALLLQAFSARG